ncbi:MAG: 2-hydroxyacid dehydrogenase [Gaiellaceae bacterium]
MSDSQTRGKIVVVDCGAGDRDRLGTLLAAAPATEIHCGVPDPDAIVERARGARVLVTLYTYTELSDKVLRQLPELELIATRTAGYTHIDVAAAEQGDIRVAIVPSATTNSVAEYVFGALFAAQRHLFEAREATRTGSWAYQGFAGFELRGATLGVVGLGSIGSRVTELGRGLGMRVLGWTRSQSPLEGVEAVELDELLAHADVVSVCLALNDDTRGLIGARELALMKPSAWLVNAARGGLVDEDALVAQLRAGSLGGAVLDVMDSEPPSAERLIELASVPNLLVTPHIAWHTAESLGRQFEETTENVLAFLRGEERNLIPLSTDGR